MGFSPAQVGEMSLFQYFAALDGFISANSSDDNKSLSEKEKDDLWAWIDGG